MTDGTTTTNLLAEAMAIREIHDKAFAEKKDGLRQWRADIISRRDAMFKETQSELKEIDAFLGDPVSDKPAEAAPRARAKTPRKADRQSTKTGDVSTGKPGPKPRADSKTTLVLQHVHKNDGARTKEIAEALGLETTEVSKTLNYHLGHNNVKSKGTRNDRQYSVTPSGRLLCKHFEKAAGA